jgi:CheY-like chemotaxis protein
LLIFATLCRHSPPTANRANNRRPACRANVSATAEALATTLPSKLSQPAFFSSLSSLLVLSTSIGFRSVFILFNSTYGSLTMKHPFGKLCPRFCPIPPKTGSFGHSMPLFPVGTILDVSSCRMKNILVIDDNEMIRNLISTVLSTYGFSVQEAANGKIGMQMIREQNPSLVICDVNMPGMDGYETLGAVRQSSSTAPIPFILMTGMVSRDGFRRGMVCGADDYLVKPFTPDELVEAVMSRLARQTDMQMAADHRAQQLHRYATLHSLPEFSANADDLLPTAA